MDNFGGRRRIVLIRFAFRSAIAGMTGDNPAAPETVVCFSRPVAGRASGA
jgi:hypothetical protein